MTAVSKKLTMILASTHAWQGYRRCDAFIVTQAPLKATVNDFWKMIWEQNCYSIVNLTPLEEEGKVRQLINW